MLERRDEDIWNEMHVLIEMILEEKGEYISTLLIKIRQLLSLFNKYNITS